MKKFENINYKNNENNYNVLNIYLPDSNEFDLYVYLHGGGLTDGDQTETELSAKYFTEHNIAVISADYRRYPDAKYPDFIEDAASAIAWFLEHIKEYGTYKKVFIGGTSAGGYLSMMLCFDEQYLAKHSLSPMDFDGFIFDAGQPTLHFNVLGEMGFDTRRVIINEMAPLYHIDTSDQYPPMLFFVSDNDMECRYEQTMLMIATLKHFGHEFPKVQLKLMENSTHCAYVTNETRNPEYTSTIYSFMKDAEKESGNK